MPRKYKRRLGSRPYINYSPETLARCLNAVKSGMPQRLASETFGIARSTIKNKLKGELSPCSNSVGGQAIFTIEEEESFVTHIVKLSEYGFPINELELRFIVAGYLNKQGRIVSKFKNNIPGYEWAKCFLKRHKILTSRFAANIKRARAATTVEGLSEFIDKLREVVEGVPPCNVWNFDETNLTDDPGNKKIICRRGTKYPERIANFSKSSTSVMFCGNAAGELLPPYVVFRAEHLWSTWCEGGPKGTRYNRSRHGWFDAATFQDWFEFQCLPVLKKQEGKKVILGDNLSSHINPYVIKLCEKNNISFVCLPPNTTHITQPLDVALFSPMKSIWRKILSYWKETDEGRRQGTLQKEHFAPLLGKLVSELGQTAPSNLKSGFRKCGIVPIDKNQIVKRLPSQDFHTDVGQISESFIMHLTRKRKDLIPTKEGKGRKRKLNVPPGQSITTNDFVDCEASATCIKIPKRTSSTGKRTENGEPLTCTSKKTSKQSLCNDCSSDEESAKEDNFYCVSSGHSDLTVTDEEESLARTEAPEKFVPHNDSVACGEFVVVVYNGVEYPGEVINKTFEEVEVNCMVRSSKAWKWPERPDKCKYEWSKVKMKIEPPIKINKRGYFRVPELETFVME